MFYFLCYLLWKMLWLLMLFMIFYDVFWLRLCYVMFINFLCWVEDNPKSGWTSCRVRLALLSLYSCTVFTNNFERRYTYMVVKLFKYTVYIKFRVSAASNASFINHQFDGLCNRLYVSIMAENGKAVFLTYTKINELYSG